MAVRDVCVQDLPPHPGLACNAYPSDLIAGLQAYRAWQQQQVQDPGWSLHEEWSWCLGHFFSLQRLHEIEETVVQLRSVLHQLKLAPEMPAETIRHVRERRKQMLTPDLEPPEACPAAAPDCDIKALLGMCTPDPKRQWLLRWCIASAFTTGTLEVVGGDCAAAMEVRFIPKSPEITSSFLHAYLRKHSDAIQSVSSGNHGKGDVFARFHYGAPARQLVQAIEYAHEVPWKQATLWQHGRYNTPKWYARECYSRHGSEFKIIPTSAASPLLVNKCTVISAGILPVANPDGRFLFSCNLCSVMPPGVVPAVLEAMYPCIRRHDKVRGTYELLCAGFREELKSLEKVLKGTDPATVRDLTGKLSSIRASIGKETGADYRDVQRIVKKRAGEAVSIMETLASLAQPNSTTSAGLGETLPSLDQPSLDVFSFIPI